MVRFENQLAAPPANGSYKTYTSLWDAVLQDGKSTSNDRSFEKTDLKPGEAVQMAAAAPHPPSEMTEEKKCADLEDEAAPSPIKADKVDAADGTESPTFSPSCSATEGTATEEGAASSNDEAEKDDYAQQSPSHYDAPGLPEVEGVNQLPGVNDETRKEEIEPSNADDTNDEVALKYKAEDEDGSPQARESPLAEHLMSAGKPEPEMLSQLMAQMVTDAAKKELESRLQQQEKERLEEEEQEQQEEEQPEKEEDEEPEVEGEKLEEVLPSIEEIDLTSAVDAESLAKAQAKLMEQAKSLAKAQALIQAQAKALARMEHQQKASPSPSPARKPKSPSRTSPHHPKPSYVRAPSDESHMTAHSPKTPPISLSSLHPPTPVREIPEFSHSASSETTVVTSNSPKRNEILSVLDGEWLSQAKSEAQAKAQALIRTAQAEAAARTQARKEAKERALAEERAQQKAEVEANLKAQAVRDAWNLEETQAAFKAEERARAKAKAAAKAAAEEKMRRKADTDAATHNVLDAQRAQAKAEAEYKLRLKANADARWLEECKARRMTEARARQEAMEKAKTASEERAVQAKREAERQQKIQEMAEAQATAVDEYKQRLKAQAIERAKVADEQQVEKAKQESERQRILQEMAAAQSRANVEHKLRLKAEADARWLAECKARREAEAEAREQAIAEAKAEAKVRAKMAKAGELPPANTPPREKGILGSLQGAQSLAAAKKLLLEPPKEFVPFGKSKGEEAEDRITLFLQVPGVVHVSEVKVELEDGVLYISRGIVLSGVDGVQKYTRSFPFEEALLDTHRIAVCLIPANATDDGVSVLQFTLPKIQSTWDIPMSLALEPAPEVEEETEVKAEVENKDNDDMKDASEASLDAPDDEVSLELVHPSDELRASKASGGDQEEESVEMEDIAEDAASPKRKSSYITKDKNGFRIVSLSVAPGLSLDCISAVYGEDSVRVAGNDGTRLSFRHVVPMNSQQVEVRELEGSYDPECGLLTIKGSLKDPTVCKPRSRRIKVIKWDEGVDSSGVISLFHDDVSISSKGTHHSCSGQQSPEHKKKGMKVLKSVASKYLRLKPKKHKHEVP